MENYKEQNERLAQVQFNCRTCPYPNYRDSKQIFCDICIRVILGKQKVKGRKSYGNKSKNHQGIK